MSHAGFRNGIKTGAARYRSAVVPILMSGLVMGAVGLSGCSGGSDLGIRSIPLPNGGITATPTPLPGSTPTPNPSASPISTNVASGTIDATGGRVIFGPRATTTGGGQVTFDFAANSLPAGVASVVASFTEINANTLTPVLGTNTYVLGFSLSTASNAVQKFTLPITINGTGVNTLATGTVLNLAKVVNGALVNIGTASVTAGGGLRVLLPTTALPGLTETGDYVIYLPTAGTSTAQANFGVVLVSDDNSSGIGLQAISIYDAAGNPLAKPTKQNLPFQGASDIDGQALTPDGSQGILVDGGNTIRFFSGLQNGALVASNTTVDISAYGGDGDSVAIMPNGDTAVVSGDSDVLLVVTGITSGNPQPAATIQLPRVCDGVVISGDGKVLVARGFDGLTVFAITASPTVAGPLGGNISNTFTQTSDQPTLGTNGAVGDGRCGMAFSPADSSRLVVIASGGGNDVALITGLPQAAVVTRKTPILGQSAKGTQQHRAAFAAFEAQRSRTGRKSRAAAANVRSTASVAITPDGTSAVVGTDAGLLLFTGVNTGVLNQAPAPPFNPLLLDGVSNLDFVPTLGITLDGRYVAAMTQNGNGTLLIIPIVPGQGFGMPVGELNGLEVPTNDQLIVH